MKRIVSIALVLAALILVAAACAPAGSAAPPAYDILYYFDDFYSTDPYVRSALDAAGHTVTQTSDASVFDAELGSGAYDLAIVLNQNDDLAIDTVALDAYVADGGRVIATDWTMTDSFAAIFDTSFTGTTNRNTVDLSDALARGITDPVTLQNPGWGTYSMGLAPLAGGATACVFGNGDSCVVLGNSGRTAFVGFLADTLPADAGPPFWTNLVAEVGAN